MYSICARSYIYKMIAATETLISMADLLPHQHGLPRRQLKIRSHYISSSHTRLIRVRDDVLYSHTSSGQLGHLGHHWQLSRSTCTDADIETL